MISVAPFMELSKSMSGARARWSLAYMNITETPVELTKSFGKIIEELDISNNRVYLRFLSNFPKLTTLVADHNIIHSQVKLPYLPELHTVWMNHNSIRNLGLFVEMLSKNCPKLRYLSLMNNEAAPSYFNGGTLEQYKEYRYLVISSLPKLIHLDFEPVTSEERKEAEKAYGVRVKKKSKKDTTSSTSSKLSETSSS